MQAASNILTLPMKPPSITTPNLQAGGPVRNTLLELANQLGEIDTLPEQLEISSRVHPKIEKPQN